MNLRSATCRWTLPGGVRSSRSAPRWEDQRCRFYLTGTPESVTENAARSRSSNSVVGSRPCHRRQASARASSSVRAAATRRSRASGCSAFQCFRSGESVVTGTSPVGVPPARPRFGDRLHASHGPCPSVLCAASLRIRTGGLADVLSASGASWSPSSFSSSSSPFGRSSCCTGSPPPITLRGGPQRGLYGEVLGEGSSCPRHAVPAP